MYIRPVFKLLMFLVWWPKYFAIIVQVEIPFFFTNLSFQKELLITSLFTRTKMAILKDPRSASVRRVFFSAALQRIKLIFLAALYRYLLESNGAQFYWVICLYVSSYIACRDVSIQSF